MHFHFSLMFSLVTIFPSLFHHSPPQSCDQPNYNFCRMAAIFKISQSRGVNKNQISALLSPFPWEMFWKSILSRGTIILLSKHRFRKESMERNFQLTTCLIQEQFPYVLCEFWHNNKHRPNAAFWYNLPVFTVPSYMLSSGAF